MLYNKKETIFLKHWIWNKMTDKDEMTVSKNDNPNV